MFSAAFLYLAAATLMFIGQRQVIYSPSTRAPTPAKAGIAGVTEVPQPTADGVDIVLWYAPPPRPGAPVIRFFHGKGGEMADRPMRYGKLLFDAAPGPKDMIVLPGVGHIDLFNPPTWALETAFLTRVIPS